MPDKPKPSKPKKSSRITNDDIALLRERRRGVEAIRASREKARAEGRPVLFETVDDIPMRPVERLMLPYWQAEARAVAELLRRVDERKEIGAAAGKRRAISDEQKAAWIVEATKLRKRNPRLSMTAVSDAVGKVFGCSGRIVRKHLAKFWERS